MPPFAIARRGLGYVPEDRRIFTDLTVDENLETGRQPPRPGAPQWTPERLFELFPNLGRMRDRPGGEGDIGAPRQQLLDQVGGEIDFNLQPDIGHVGLQPRDKGRDTARRRDLPRADPHHPACLAVTAAAEQRDLHVAQQRVAIPHQFATRRG